MLERNAFSEVADCGVVGGMVLGFNVGIDEEDSERRSLVALACVVSSTVSGGSFGGGIPRERFEDRRFWPDMSVQWGSDLAVAMPLTMVIVSVRKC